VDIHPLSGVPYAKKADILTNKRHFTSLVPVCVHLHSEAMRRKAASLGFLALPSSFRSAPSAPQREILPRILPLAETAGGEKVPGSDVPDSGAHWVPGQG